MICLTAGLCNAKFGFKTNCFHPVSFSSSLLSVCNIQAPSYFLGLIFLFFFAVSPCSHSLRKEMEKNSMQTYTTCSHAFASSPSMSDFQTCHLTEWLVNMLLQACMKCCHLLPLSRQAARQSIRQAEVCLEDT